MDKVVSSAFKGVWVGQLSVPHIFPCMNPAVNMFLILQRACLSNNYPINVKMNCSMSKVEYSLFSERNIDEYENLCDLYVITNFPAVSQNGTI